MISGISFGTEKSSSIQTVISSYLPQIILDDD